MPPQPQSPSPRYLTMREVMDLPSLKGSTLLAGESGLDRIVSNAMVMEGPDVGKWAKPGFVLVTSFFALEPLDWKQRFDFFNLIAEIGVAGIIYKPGRLESRAVERYIEICDEKGIPVVQMDPEVNFEAVLMDIMGHAIDSNTTLLNSFYDVHRQVIRLAMQQPNLHTVILRLSSQIGMDVTYYDRAEDTRIGTNEALASFDGISLQDLVYRQYQSYRYHSATITREGQDDEAALAVLVPRQTAGASYLIIHEDPKDISAFARMTIENYMSLVVVELVKKRAIEESQFSRSNLIVHDLLQNRFATNDEVDAVLSELGADTHNLYRVMLVRIFVTDPSHADRAGEVLTVLRRKIKRLYAHSVYYEASSRITFLRNHTSNSAGFDRDAVEKILGEMHGDPSLPEFTHLVALSSEGGRYSIGSLTSQVMGINRLFDSNRLGNRFVDYDSLGIYKFIIETGDLSLVANYIDPRVVRLHAENPEGFETLVALCECGLNYGEASKRLFIHSKTIRYRVGRIKELYGIDVANPDDAVQVILAGKVAMLLGADWEAMNDGPTA